MPWSIQRLKDLLPNRPFGKTAKDNRVARLVDLDYVINSSNDVFSNIENSVITTLTTAGTSGPATLVGNTLNIPIITTPYKAYRAKLTAGEIDWLGYGFLYNWFAVDDTRGLANPAGGTGLTSPNEWRVPSDTDWNTLISYITSSNPGYTLKSTLNSISYPYYGWFNNGGGTDDYNFSGLPGGFRSFAGIFQSIGYTGLWWSSTLQNTDQAFYSLLTSDSNSLSISTTLEGTGLSVRLVREATAGELLLNDGDTSDTSSLDSYTGNDGTVYVTVKISTQIWLAQNLRETLYNNTDPIFNAAFLPGGDSSDTTWEAKRVAGEGAYTVFIYYNPGTNLAPYLPDTIELIYADVLENSLGATVNWTCELDGTNTYYKARLLTRTWYPTHIKLTPGYDVSDYDNSVATLTQKNMVVKRAVTGEFYIDFFPVTIDSSGTLTIEPLNNYSDLLGSPDSSVYVEILEYQPESYYYSSSLSQGIGISNL